MKTCKICQIVKPLTEFNPASKYKDKIYYRGECKKCNLKKQSSDQTAQIKYRKSENGKITRKKYKQSEKYKTYQREYDKNREYNEARKISKYNYVKNRLKEDPFYRLRLNVRNRLRGAMRARNWHKDNEFSKYIGCNKEELEAHIEKQFSPEMTWDNYAVVWEVDHVRALGFANNEDEIYDLCHHLNLKPILIEDHKKKTIEDCKQIKEFKISKKL